MRLRLCMSLVALAFVAAPFAYPSRAGEDGGPRVFRDPDAASAALVAAVRSHDVDALVALVGTRHGQLFRTGDAKADHASRARFIDAASERVRLEYEGDERVTVLVGYADWAFPIPLMAKDKGWIFDGAAGAAEVLDRRIGANEIAAITFCEALYMAQSLYHATDHDGDGVLEYATRVVSTPGSHDGLYWEPQAGEAASPLGRVLGIRGKGALGVGPCARWMGYTFRLLCSQGQCAPGGAHGYVINGNMIAGFAVIATPQHYGDSGIASFLMGPNSIVHERDFGVSTPACAGRMVSFQPDRFWNPVDSEPRTRRR